MSHNPTRLVLQKRLRWVALLSSAVLLAAGGSCKSRSFNVEGSAVQDAGPAGASARVDPSSLYDRVDSPALLMDLEEGGYHFGQLLPGASGLAVNNKELFDRNPAYRTLVSQIESDVKKRAASDPELGPTQNYSHRSIDQRMLVSPEATFELTGVFNRADMSLEFSELCTAVRFLYRLGYKHNNGGRIDGSRLPMTVALNFAVPFTNAANCAAYLNRWTGSPSLENLLSKNGPLSGNFVNSSSFVSLEMNYQLQTWPSSVAQGMGAFAEYVFRVFSIKGGIATPKLLHNTIDVAKIKNSGALRNELKTFLIDNAAKVARGTARIPEKFLAQSSSAFTPNGLSRLSNRPYGQVFSAKDFAGISFAGLKHVGSAEEFLVRLNDMSCAGCHSGRSVNAFHHLGEERPNATHRRNQFFNGFSEYARVTKATRLKILRAKAGEADTSGMELPISVKPPQEGAEYGSTCALDAHSGAGKNFAGWRCKSGLTCKQTDEPQSEKMLGKCVPTSFGYSGDACNIGHTTESADAKAEKMVVTENSNCGGISQCSNLGGGFPGGMCRRGCSELDSSKEACGPIASGGFNECLSAPGKTFIDCLQNNTAQNGRSRCDRNRPCRADYFCAKAENTESYGACVPGYFFFQLGMDAHPILPTSGAGVTLDFKPAAKKKLSVQSASAKSGLVLKKKPIQQSLLAEGESCVVPDGFVAGIGRQAGLVNGHIPVEIIAPSSKCPGMVGLVYVYKDSAKFE